MITLNEPIVRAVVDRLENELADIIDSINAENEDFQMDHPRQVLAYPPTIRLLTQFPTVAVVDGPSRFTDDTAWSATGMHRLSIVVFDESLDQEELAWNLRRFARAIAACVLRDRRLPPEGWGVTLERVDPGQLLGRRENPDTKMSWVSLTILVRTDEDA